MRILKQKLMMTELALYALPASSKILAVQMQGEDICMWFSVDENDQDKLKTFYIEMQGTGHVFSEIDHNGVLKHIGTVQLLNGAYVCHVFYRESN